MIAARRFSRLIAPALLGALACSSCLRVDWSRDRWQTPPSTARDATALEVGASLAEVFAALGAPLVVREHRTVGVVVVYGWNQIDSRGANVSVPVSDQLSLSLELRRGRNGARGLLLFFDRDLRLTAAGEGWLDDPRDNNRSPSPSVPASLLETP